MCSNTWTRNTLFRLLLLPLCLATFLTAEQASAQGTEPIVLTGTRTWEMADGTKRRMRLLGFDKSGQRVYLQTTRKRKPTSGLVSNFSVDDKKLLMDIRSGRVKLTKTAGLDISPDFQRIDRKRPMWLMSQWVGVTRMWTNRNGKKINAALINLTDEDATLLIKNSIWRQQLSDLSKNDIEYLDRVKKGDEPLYPGQVSLGGAPRWDGDMHAHIAACRGEQLPELHKAKGTFEEILAAALTHTQKRYQGKDLKLLRFEEIPTALHSDTPLPSVVASNPKPASIKFPVYRAVFTASEKSRGKITRLWPATTTPRSWSQLIFHVYMLPDKTVATVIKTN